MLFNSIDFVGFYAVVVVAYALLHRHWKLRKTLLLLSSYWFYMAWNPPFVVLLFLSTLLDFVAGRRIEAAHSLRTRRLWLLASCLVNLGVLFFFKYSDFLLSNVWMVLEPPLTYPAIVSDLVLPLGISFFTFQSLGYTIDVYRGRTAATDSLLDFAVYVAFFPQLVAGPIIRSTQFLPQLRSNHSAASEDVLAGLNQIARGFAKKLLGADLLASYVDLVYAAPDSFGSLNHLLAIYAYAFQIYFDFSGYTDIAIGTARTLGFEIPRNFDLPYLARGPADFWRRWHISLSTWLRDYLYIPLGGSRGSGAATYRNLIVTMLLGGLWHGAAWGFVLWGAFHGLWLALHRALFRDRAGFWIPRSLSIFATFHAVCFGWILFRARTWDNTVLVLRGLADFTTPFQEISPVVVAVLAAGFASHVLGASQRLIDWWNDRAIDGQVATWVAVTVAVFLFSNVTVKFIYFQF